MAFRSWGNGLFRVPGTPRRAFPTGFNVLDLINLVPIQDLFRELTEYDKLPAPPRKEAGDGKGMYSAAVYVCGM